MENNIYIPFAQISNGSLLLSFSPKKYIKAGIVIQLSLSPEESTLPFMFTDLIKGKQDYTLDTLGVDESLIKYIFVRQ